MSTLYGKDNFIKRMGHGAKIETFPVKEAAPPGTVMNMADRTVVDAGDEQLGVLITKYDMSVDYGTDLTIYDRALFVRRGQNVVVKCRATGTISAGERVIASQTAGKLGCVEAEDDDDVSEFTMGTAITAQSSGYAWIDLSDI